jgi:glyoxylase-like metal-dependent hydrolase (beta-lactamase superfamily II)
MFTKLLMRLPAAFFIACPLLGVAAPSYAGDAPLSLHPYRSDESAFSVASVLVTAKTDAGLIDAQFTRADAHRVVAEVLASGKQLRWIYVSQGDPDYYFGLEVIHQAFPQARIVATRATVEHIKASLPEKLKIWRPMLGANGPSRPIIPAVLKGDRIDLEGQTLQIIGLDGPSPLYTFVWIPSIKAVVGGVRVFGDMHLWMTDSQTEANRQCWTNDLRRIEALAPQTVIAGHAKQGVSNDLGAVHFSIEYLAVYGEELAKAKDSTALISAMKTHYPDAIGNEVLSLGAKVNKGEMKWISADGCH